MTKKYKSDMDPEPMIPQATLIPQEALLELKKSGKSITIGVPKEISDYENRVALTPEAVALLVNNGLELIVETKAGAASKFSDKEYSDAGAKINQSPREVFEADIVLKIDPPTQQEIEYMKPGKVIISALQLGQQSIEYIQLLNRKKLITMAFELIEDRQGGMPVVRAMSEIAGSASILIAAEYLSSVSNGKGIILGGITGVRPTKIIILGAGTVAEHAARAATGLGAQVQIFDNNIYKLRRLRHVLGFPVYTSTIDTFHLSQSLKTADVLIGAVRSDKGKSKSVVTEEMVMQMKQDSVIIDICIDQGGCVETSRLTNHKEPVFIKHGVIHYCVPNIAARVSRTASTALSNIFTPILLQMADEGGVDNMIINNKWFMKGVYTYKGNLTNPFLANKFGVKYRDLSLFMAARF